MSKVFSCIDTLDTLYTSVTLDTLGGGGDLAIIYHEKICFAQKNTFTIVFTYLKKVGTINLPSSLIRNKGLK